MIFLNIVFPCSKRQKIIYFSMMVRRVGHKMKCDNCLSTDTYVKMYHHKYQIKNKEIEFDAERRFCFNCNKIVYACKLDNNAGQMAISLYNKKYGLPK